MDAKKNKIIAKAKGFVQKDQFEKALAEYRKAIGTDAPETQIALEVIDLLTRIGRIQEAVDSSLEFAKRYSKSGFHLKAVAVLKKALEVDAGAMEAGEHLARSYLDLGLTSEALSQFNRLADAYEEQSETSKLIKVLNQIIEIDTANIAVRQRMAEHLSKENRFGEAVLHLSTAARELKRQKRYDEFLKAAERLLKMDSNRAEVALEAAEVYLERKDFKRALAMLQICFAGNPRDINTLEMLATAFLGINQQDKAISVYRQICLILQESKNEEMRKMYLEIILEIDPKNEFARKELGVVW